MNPHSLEVLEFGKVRRMILRWTFSAIGRELAEGLGPDLDLPAILISQERITEWKRLELRGAAPGTAELADLRPCLIRLGRGTAALDSKEIHGFLPLLDHLALLHRLKSDTAWREAAAPRLQEILDGLADFSSLRSRLRVSVGPSGEILDTASPELARIRREFLQAQQQAADLLEGLLGRITEHREDSFVTLRDGRYVVSLRAQQRALLPGLVHGHSQTGQSLLVEPLEAVEANNRVAEGREEEKREEARILSELTAFLRDRAGELARGFELAGLLDLIRAQARLALELRAEAPQLNLEGTIRIAQGRHPILAEAEARGGGAVVPLDLELRRDCPVLLLSGPNMGGKSVALKTVGLLILMARAGLHVPAGDGTDLPLVDEVFVDLGDEQSIEGDLSTFAGHLRNIGRLWQEATSRSLVLLDELGAGTDPEEGAALAMAILEGMAERGALALATTHLSSLKLFASEQPRMQNAAMEFDSVTLTPRFRLRLGEPGRSRAFDIARRILPESSLLARAETHRSPHLVRMDHLLSEVDREKQAVERERQGLEAERERLREAVALREKQAGRLRERLSRLRAGREEAIGRLYQEAEDFVRGLRQELESKAREQPSAALPEVRRAEREVSRRRFEASPRKSREKRGRRLGPERLRPGEAAWLPGLEARVTIERVAEGRVWVEWQGRRLEVPEHVLEEPPDAPGVPHPQGRSPVSIEEPSGEPVGRELDLRGLRAEEALERLDRFLDRASLQKLHQVRIVHGKGTGALKREVEKHLRSHPLVDGFRIGELGEGGWGVTVVDLGPGGD